MIHAYSPFELAANTNPTAFSPSAVTTKLTESPGSANTEPASALTVHTSLNQTVPLKYLDVYITGMGVVTRASISPVVRAVVRPNRASACGPRDGRTRGSTSTRRSRDYPGSRAGR